MVNLVPILINLCESCLFFYLICHRLTCKAGAKKLIIFGILCNTVFVTVMNYFSPSIALSMAVFSLFYIVLTYFYTEGKHVEKIFYGLLFPIIARLSDLFVLTIANLFTGSEISSMLKDDASYNIMAIFYIILETTLVYLCSHIRKQLFALPVGIFIVLPIIIFTGIVSSELLFTYILEHETTLKQIEKIVLYGCLFANLFVFLCCVIFVGYISKTYQKNILLTEENKFRQLEWQQYNAALDGVEAIRNWRHDFSQHLGVIGSFIESGQSQEAGEYIRKLSNNIQQAIPIVSTGNYIVDAVLSSKMNVIRKSGIRFTYQVIVPSKLPMEDTDVCSLLGNILDNAIESCRKLDGKEAYIDLSIKPYKNSLVIKLTNSSTGEYKLDSDKFPLSTKPYGSHGIGLRRIMQIVSSANGICGFQPEKDSFTANIALPLDMGSIL